MERCIDCQYYDRHQPTGAANKSAHAGQCRRQAPALSPLNAKSYMIEGVWPTIRDDDWCGEWKLRSRRTESRVVDGLVGSGMPVATPMPRVGGAAASPSKIGAAHGDD